VQSAEPKISIIITTYNRGDLLRRQLQRLTDQTLPVEEFEVVVADDGSSDDTKSIVEEFAGRLPLAYHYQEDLGFRVCAARNAGARLARAPVLAFLDAGAIPGPGLVAAHLAAHADPARRRVVAGYGHAFSASLGRLDGLGELIDELPLDEVVQRYAGDPEFLDGRFDRLAAVGFDMDRDRLPWQIFFTFNFSVRADDFRAVDGFDEAFVQWGGEDLELGYRFARSGMSFHFDRDAWIVEWPHDRPMVERMRHFTENMLLFLAKSTEPAVEVGYPAVRDVRFWEWPDWYQEVVEHARAVRDVEVAGEIADALARVDAPGRVAVFGCGPVVPAGLSDDAILMDFDADLVDRATRDARHSGQHAIGIRTTLPEQSVDTVIITTRLDGLWERWGSDLMAEAHRIGRRVEVVRAEPVPRSADEPDSVNDTPREADHG